MTLVHSSAETIYQLTDYVTEYLLLTIRKLVLDLLVVLFHLRVNLISFGFWIVRQQFKESLQTLENKDG